MSIAGKKGKVLTPEHVSGKGRIKKVILFPWQWQQWREGRNRPSSRSPVNLTPTAAVRIGLPKLQKELILLTH